MIAATSCEFSLVPIFGNSKSYSASGALSFARNLIAASLLSSKHLIVISPRSAQFVWTGVNDPSVCCSTFVRKLSGQSTAVRGDGRGEEKGQDGN